MSQLFDELGIDAEDSLVVHAKEDARTLTETILQLVERRKHLK
ncbi:hypothetical protein [Pseudarthrobacter sp. SSS035]|nr:hypothetical protein [Pseudarthrobacter sp. SSS035]